MTNRYPGINPHLNSFLQQQTGWKGFHARHRADLGAAIDPLLPDAYYIADEESLQIGIYDRTTQASIAASRTVPDITVYRHRNTGQPQPPTAGVSTPTLTLPVLEVADDEPDYLGSLVIYRLEAGVFPGVPVTRLELLSPANKPPGSHAEKYRLKREETLRSGLRLVEIDYLHQQPPITNGVPNYQTGDADAFPYYIAVVIRALRWIGD